jgi:hypothetical protein
LELFERFCARRRLFSTFPGWECLRQTLPRVFPPGFVRRKTCFWAFPAGDLRGEIGSGRFRMENCPRQSLPATNPGEKVSGERCLSLTQLGNP